MPLSPSFLAGEEPNGREWGSPTNPDPGPGQGRLSRRENAARPDATGAALRRWGQTSRHTDGPQGRAGGRASERCGGPSALPAIPSHRPFPPRRPRRMRKRHRTRHPPEVSLRRRGEARAAAGRAGRGGAAPCPDVGGLEARARRRRRLAGCASRSGRSLRAPRPRARVRAPTPRPVARLRPAPCSPSLSPPPPTPHRPARSWRAGRLALPARR